MNSSPLDISTAPARSSFWAMGVFLVTVLAYCIVWVLLPYWFQPNFRPDIIESLFIAPNNVWGSHKHPSFTAECVEFFFNLTGRSSAAPYLLSQTASFISLWAIWQLGRQYLSEKLALYAVFSMMTYWYFANNSVMFNNNTSLITFWCLSILSLYYALKTNRLVFWISTGIALGIGCLCKYTMVYLIASILLLMFTHSKARGYWKNIGPYITTLVAFLIFLPHLLWLVDNNFTCLVYASDHKAKITFLPQVMMPLKFLVSQGLLVLPVCGVLLPLTTVRYKLRREETPDQKYDLKSWERKFLFAMWFYPFFLMLLTAIIGKMSLRSALGSSLCPIFAVLLLSSLKLNIKPLTEKRVKYLISATVICLMVGFVLGCYLPPYLKGKPSRIHFPGKTLAKAVEDVWHQQYAVPIPYIGGEWWLAGNVAVYGQDRPVVHAHDPIEAFTGNRLLSSWSADADLNENGGVLLWKPDHYQNDVPPELFERFPDAIICEKTIVLPYQTKADIPPLEVGMALIPPK